MKNIKSKLAEFFDKRTKQSILVVILGTIIYSISVVWFLNVGEFFAGGITGISQLISKFIWGEVTPIVGVFIGLINFPLFLVGTRGVSRKFAMLTLISVGLQMILIAVFQIIADDWFNPFKEFVHTVTDTGDVVFDNGARLLIAILGGAVSGVGLALCLKCGGSSGGMDVIANCLLVRKNISFTKYSFIVDLIIISASSIISIETALFTIIRLICSNLVVSNLYTSYKVFRLEIFTTVEKTEELRSKILEKFQHGITIFEVVGGYTLEERRMLEIILSRYEVDEYISYIEKIDPKAFISVSEMKSLRGNYVKRTVV